MVGTDFGVSIAVNNEVESTEDHEHEHEDGWTLTSRLLRGDDDENGDEICTNIQEITSPDFDSETSLAVLEWCQLSTEADLEEFLPPGTYTIVAESSGEICSDQQINRTFDILNDCEFQVGVVDRLDLVIANLATEPAVGELGEFSFT